MPSRLYGTDQPSTFQPTPQNASGTPVWRNASPAKSGSQETRTQTGAGGAYTSNVLWVSPPLAAQTISGTATCAIFYVLVASAALPYVRIWASQGATNAVRGTLLAQSGGQMDVSNPVVENAATFSGGSASLTSVAVQAGDRLVIQLDMDGAGSAQLRNRWGGTGADATANSTTTSQTSWLEFSQTLVWLAPSVRAFILE